MTDYCLACGSYIQDRRMPTWCETPMGVMVVPCNNEWHRGIEFVSGVRELVRITPDGLVEIAEDADENTLRAIITLLAHQLASRGREEPPRD